MGSREPRDKSEVSCFLSFAVRVMNSPSMSASVPMPWSPLPPGLHSRTAPHPTSQAIGRLFARPSSFECARPSSFGCATNGICALGIRERPDGQANTIVSKSPWPSCVFIVGEAKKLAVRNVRIPDSEHK